MGTKAKTMMHLGLHFCLTVTTSYKQCLKQYKSIIWV